MTDADSPLVDDTSGAELDDAREYRWRLWREWDAERPTVAFLMLNPSTADETEDDQTIRRCIGYGKSWGYGRLEVVNLFAYRTKKPSELRTADAPVGDRNDEVLRDVCQEAELVVAAWGAHGEFSDRAIEVAEMLDVELQALGTTKDGHPGHPLYLSGDAEPEPWDPNEIRALTDGGTPGSIQFECPNGCYVPLAVRVGEADQDECDNCGTELVEADDHSATEESHD